MDKTGQEFMAIKAGQWVIGAYYTVCLSSCVFKTSSSLSSSTWWCLVRMGFGVHCYATPSLPKNTLPMGFLLQCSKTLFYSVFEDIFSSTIGFSLSKLVNFILNFTYLSFILINFPLIPFFRFFLYTYQEGLKTFFCARNFFFGCVKSACFINSFNSHVMKADILILCFCSSKHA